MKIRSFGGAQATASYRWLSGKIGTDVEVVPMNDADSDKLVGLKLLSHDCATDCIAMQQLSESLSDMQIATRS